MSTPADATGTKLEKAPFPNLLSTPERWMARMRVHYLGVKNAEMYGKLQPTDEDFEAFKQEYPEEGQVFDRVRLQTQVIKYGTIIGTTASVGYALRYTRTKPYIVTAAGLGSLVSALTSDHIGSWVSGSFKYDTVGLNQQFLIWLEKKRSASPSSTTTTNA